MQLLAFSRLGPQYMNSLIFLFNRAIADQIKIGKRASSARARCPGREIRGQRRSLPPAAILSICVDSYFRS